MDVQQMLEFHIESDADCTVAAIPYPREKSSAFGIVGVNDNWQMNDFTEKPQTPLPMPGDESKSLVSMGNYIFKADVLIDAVKQDAQDPDSLHDFGKNIIPSLFKHKKVMVYDYAGNDVPGMQERERGYWRDVGNLDNYWESSMDLISISPVIDIHNPKWPLLSYTTFAPPAKFIWADRKTRRIGISTDSLVSEGCIISGGHIHRTILSPNVRINSFSNVEESILFHGVDIGRHAMVRKAIIDKNVKIPPYMQIGYDIDQDRERFTVSEGGVVVIPKDTKLT
jgi:glucose-1-phosphate adenylyltransferase